MKTMSQEAAPRGPAAVTADPEPHAQVEASPAPATTSPLEAAIPWLVPCAALLILLVTGAIWAAAL
jgi:hypothetical protein